MHKSYWTGSGIKVFWLNSLLLKYLLDIFFTRRNNRRDKPTFCCYSFLVFFDCDRKTTQQVEKWKEARKKTTKTTKIKAELRFNAQQKCDWQNSRHVFHENDAFHFCHNKDNHCLIESLLLKVFISSISTSFWNENQKLWIKMCSHWAWFFSRLERQTCGEMTKARYGMTWTNMRSFC